MGRERPWQAFSLFNHGVKCWSNFFWISSRKPCPSLELPSVSFFERKGKNHGNQARRPAYPETAGNGNPGRSGQRRTGRRFPANQEQGNLLNRQRPKGPTKGNPLEDLLENVKKDKDGGKYDPLLDPKDYGFDDEDEMWRWMRRAAGIPDDPQQPGQQPPKKP